MTLDLDVASFALAEAREAAKEYLAVALSMDVEDIPSEISSDGLIELSQSVEAALKAAYDAGYDMGVLHGGADATALAEMQLVAAGAAAPLGAADMTDADAAVIDALTEQMQTVEMRLDVIETELGLKFVR